MSIQNGNTYAWIYERYLIWFRDNAKPTTAPQDEDGLLRFSLCHEDIFACESVTLNEMFFVVPLLPSESMSGKLELFSFAEVNLIMKDPKSGECDLITPVRYMVM